MVCVFMGCLFEKFWPFNGGVTLKWAAHFVSFHFHVQRIQVYAHINIRDTYTTKGELDERMNEQMDGQTDRFDDLWTCGIWDIGSKASEVWYTHSLGILIWTRFGI